MNIVQKPVAPNNYHHGRSGHPIVAIVIHIEDGTEVGTDAWFDDPQSHVSSHYSIKNNGEIHQYVADVNTAFHAGKVVRPSWQLILAGEYAGVNPNYITLGIEHEGKSGIGLTAQQFEASAELIASLAHAHNVAIDELHIVPHHAIRADKTCPGSGVDVQSLINRAAHYAGLIAQNT